MKTKIIWIFPILLLAVACASRRSITASSEPERLILSPKATEKAEIDAPDKTAGEPFSQTGVASWYGEEFQGKTTSNMEVYDMFKLTAAHQTLPFHTLVEVHNLENDLRVTVRINDRGPFLKDRIIDLSYKAAKAIQMEEKGTALVSLRILKFGPSEISREASLSVRYIIQAGAFQILENAMEVLKKIDSLSPESGFTIWKEDGWFKLRSRYLQNRMQAEDIQRILSRGGIDSYVREIQ